MNTCARYDDRFMAMHRDYASLPLNYSRIHGEPMPAPLQVEVITLRNDTEARHGR